MSDIAIRVTNVSKTYQIYDKPHDRLKQSLWRGRKQFYWEFKALDDVSFEVKKEGDSWYHRAQWFREIDVVTNYLRHLHQQLAKLGLMVGVAIVGILTDSTMAGISGRVCS